MINFILEDGTAQRYHRQHLKGLLTSTKGELRVASAYVTERALLLGATGRKRRLLVSLLPMDVASGATCLETLGALIESGVDCSSLPDRPRLHAKVYIFGSSDAVVTSANLTNSALDSNIEVGVAIHAERVAELVAWFNALWNSATPLTLKRLAELQKSTKALRAAYQKLKKKAKTQLQLPQSGSGELCDTLEDAFVTAKQFFVCNTDRRQGERTAVGGYALEQAMFNRGYAAAWEDFKFPGHMDEVGTGAMIFMFAKSVGIIAIGIATGSVKKLLPNATGRIRNFSREKNTVEWRVPVKWLARTDEAGAYPYKPPHFTFWDVTDAEYDDLREGVKTHFLGAHSS